MSDHRIFPTLLAAFGLSIISSPASADDSNALPHQESAEGRVQISENYRHLKFSSLGQDYSDFKDWLQKKYGFGYSLTASFTAQYGAPGGHNTALQTILYPAFTWNLFNNSFGNAVLNFAYNIVQYTGANSGTIDDNIGVVTSINDYDDQSNEFPELYISYQLPGKYDWLTVGLGQYPISNFDGTTYDSNQQENFINWTFSQNASASYPTAGLGSYIQITPTPEWSFAAGFQDATNVDGTRISTSHLDEKHYATFGYVSYSPVIKGLGQGQYSFLYYNQPWVEAQPQTTNGWSVNFSQNLDEKWAVFGRVNGVSGEMEEIDNSWLLGVVMNNPFNRNPLDQIGFAGALNHINEDAVGEPVAHNYEKVIEGYITLGISKWMTLTPDIQVYFDPALNPSSDTAFAFSLRATLFF